jgi:DnaD/phage-associated family protein
VEGGAVALPEELFDDVLPRVTDLTELKAILYVNQLSRTPRPAVPYGELLDGRRLRAIVGLDTPEPAEDRLRRAVDRAVAGGFLYRVSAGTDVWLLPATRSGRALLDRLRGGEDGALSAIGLPAATDVTVHRPNVFSLYERHIGPLTPLVAEQIRDAERIYPRAWIEDAVLIAADNNRRSWRYVEAILVRWEAEGGPR